MKKSICIFEQLCKNASLPDMKTKHSFLMSYENPHTVITLTELEGLVCESSPLNVQVDELKNVNTAVDADKVDTKDDPFYYEF